MTRQPCRCLVCRAVAMRQPDYVIARALTVEASRLYAVLAGAVR
jgi:hypothetical protein